MNFLIVKTSAIGDVVQSFGVLEYLKDRFPSSNIDWVVSPASFSLVSSHPLVRKAIIFDIDKTSLKKMELFRIKKFYKALRENYYAAVFDLQGNCKSGLITLFCRGRDKIGFGSKNVAEWPNLLCTTFQYNVENGVNISGLYLLLVQKYFKDNKTFIPKKRLLTIDQIEKKKIDLILQCCKKKGVRQILVCPSSRWRNKELNINVLKNFLSELNQNLKVFYFFLWGDEREKKSADQLHHFFDENSAIIDRIDLPTLQNLISRLDFVICMDSCPLHLAGSVDTPSFSFFGPTSSQIYKPFGDRHLAFQGTCPLNKKFQKRCSELRSCQDPRCISDVDYQKISKLFLDLVNR